MSATGLDILLGLTMIACNQYSPAENNPSMDGASPRNIASQRSIADWGQYACREYGHLGEEVEIELVSYRVTAQGTGKRDQLDTLRGAFSSEQRQSGSIKISWSVPDVDFQMVMWAKLKVYDTVWVFTDNLHPYQRISPRHLREQKKEIARYLGRYAPLSPESDTFVTSAQVRKGDMLSTSNSVRSPMVFKNESIEITLDTQNIKITSDGTALDYGWEQGDKILVRAENAEGPVFATVVGRNKVHVQN